MQHFPITRQKNVCRAKQQVVISQGFRKEVKQVLHFKKGNFLPLLMLLLSETIHLMEQTANLKSINEPREES